MRITISGPPGSGKTTVAKVLASRLGYELVSGGEIFREMAREMGMDLVEFSRYAEKNWEIDRRLDSRLVELARSKENVVIDSRLSGWLMHLNGIPAYKVFVDASLDVRVSRIRKREGGDEESVKRATLLRESSEKKRYLEIYGIDFDDLSIYDLVVNSDSLTPEEIVDMILEGIGYGAHS